VCEVVLYSPNHSSSLAEEPVKQIYKLVRVWTDRFRELSALDFVKYIFIFENKGEAIGVTLHHPHGQIYAYPFIPPRIATELKHFGDYQEATGKCLLCEVLSEELNAKGRIVAENDSFAALIPFFARWPYETHIYSKRHFQALPDMSDAETKDLASILKMVLVAFDKLFDISFPYMMVMHQRPVDGQPYDFYHFHIEFYPPLRSANRLKYLAGSETGAGMFINDTLPEEKAAELRSHVREVVWQAPDSKTNG
jgi:UDPglucose--hexose-1-phosphate uridylyltransferase